MPRSKTSRSRFEAAPPSAQASPLPLESVAARVVDTIGCNQHRDIKFNLVELPIRAPQTLLFKWLAALHHTRRDSVGLRVKAWTSNLYHLGWKYAFDDVEDITGLERRHFARAVKRHQLMAIQESLFLSGNRSCLLTISLPQPLRVRSGRVGEIAHYTHLVYSFSH